MYIFKAEIAFSDHTTLGLNTIQLKTSEVLFKGDNEISFIFSCVRNFVEKEKPVRIVYLMLGLQDLRLSEVEHQNDGGLR